MCCSAHARQSSECAPPLSHRNGGELLPAVQGDSGRRPTAFRRALEVAVCHNAAQLLSSSNNVKIRLSGLYTTKIQIIASISVTEAVVKAAMFSQSSSRRCWFATAQAGPVRPRNQLCWLNVERSAVTHSAGIATSSSGPLAHPGHADRYTACAR
jgi:hypothetical protein